MEIINLEDIENKKEYSIYKKYKNGEISRTEYGDYVARKAGFKDRKDYENKRRYLKGEHLPLHINNQCSLYLGVNIAENLLPLMFENVEKMPYGNEGYDFICGNGYKIDVKSSCLTYKNELVFHIKHNKIADYFMLVCFDNREDLNIGYIWLIKGNEIIRGKKFNEYEVFFVTTGYNAIKALKKYELESRLDIAKKLCNEFKEKIKGKYSKKWELKRIN